MPPSLGALPCPAGVDLFRIPKNAQLTLNIAFDLVHRRHPLPNPGSEGCLASPCIPRKQVFVGTNIAFLEALHVTNLHLIEGQKRLNIDQTVELWDGYELCCDQQVGP